MYNQVISLGFFCSVAMEMQRIGLRSKSAPFDWVISDLTGTMTLIQDQFKDFLEPAYLVQDPAYPYIFTNQKCGISFYHDFKPGIPLAYQLQSVQDKYARRIKRFYEDLKGPVLLIRYIKDQAEYDLLCRQYWGVLAVFQSFNKENEMLFIANQEVQTIEEQPMRLYKVEKDARDLVARHFLDKNRELMQYLMGPIIPPEVRQTNKIWAKGHR